jgi:para-aminobenzoate synthetase component 1
LPAGSVSGAPKRKTLEIIQEAEGEKRGYYTGITGYFDGEKLDSAVMIRYIEQVDDQLYYRSGGGVTTQSVCKNEYDEALAKVYVPVV